MTRFLKGLMLTAILAAAPCSGYSQCTDSSTKAEINLYLAEGAKARALVPLYQERIKIDSLEIIEHKKAVEHLQRNNDKLTQKLSLWRIIAPLAFVVGLLL
jgi:predicted xylose isomerase-like sugar epimerase